MKSFREWLEAKNEGIFGPGMPQPQRFNRSQPAAGGVPQQQSAQPVQQPQLQQSPGQQVSLSTLADKVTDITWHQLYDEFTRQYRMSPNDPQVTQLGKLLYQAASTGNMQLLKGSVPAPEVSPAKPIPRPARLPPIARTPRQPQPSPAKPAPTQWAHFDAGD